MVESSVQAKTGSSFWEMTLLRLIMSFVIAFFLNWVMPHEGWGQVGIAQSAAVCDNWLEVFVLWFTSSMKVVISILIIVTALMILHYILEEFNLMKGLSSVFSPLMRLFGLPQDAAFLWLVGNVVGLAYGGAIMVEQMEQRKLSYGDGNLLNHHLAVCHSLLEDTIIFMNKERFLRLLNERILILDGGMGTMIQSFKLNEQDYRGERFADFPGQLKGNNDLLCITRPDVIQSIHRQYLDAGADIFATNTFNANAISMADYAMEAYVREINLAAGRLSREVADTYMAELP